MKSRISRGLRRRSSLRGDESFLDGFASDALGVDAGAVVGDADHNLIAFLSGIEADRALAGLACLLSNLWGLDAVVERISYEVDHGVADEFDHGLVEFGVFAVEDELRIFFQSVRDVANQAGEAAENHFDRDHASFERGALEFVGDVAEAGAGLSESRVKFVGCDFGQ